MTRTEIERRIRSWTRERDDATSLIHEMAVGAWGAEYDKQRARWQRATDALAILGRKLAR